MDEIDISGVDKSNLLYELWKRQKVAGFYSMNGLDAFAPKFNTEEAKQATSRYIDYHQGRAIKCDISKDTAFIGLYERDAGKGKFKEAVDAARK